MVQFQNAARLRTGKGKKKDLEMMNLRELQLHCRDLALWQGLQWTARGLRLT